MFLFSIPPQEQPKNPKVFPEKDKKRTSMISSQKEVKKGIYVEKIKRSLPQLEESKKNAPKGGGDVRGLDQYVQTKASRINTSVDIYDRL